MDLGDLYNSNKYLFHGSPDKFAVLEPRQPTTFDKERAIMVADGDPCVAATPYLNIAIFRAIINSKNISGKYWSGFSYDEKTNSATLRASSETLDKAKDKHGYVYVLNKVDFKPRDPENPEGMEWRTNKTVTPVEVVAVSFDDLPTTINIENSPL